MASSRESSADSKKSYNSDDVVGPENFALTDEVKTECLEGMHCSQDKNKPLPSSSGIYATLTSRWARNKKYAACAYTLLKVKRWYLTDENYLFDPLKKCNTKVPVLNPLWRTMSRNSPTYKENKFSLDSILNKFTDQSKQAMKTLDGMLEPLDDAVNCSSEDHTVKLCRELTERASLALERMCRKEFMEFVHVFSNVILRKAILDKGARIPEVVYENTFQCFITCLSAFLGSRESEEVCCKRTVDNATMEKIAFPVKLASKTVTLEVSSKPDLFIFQRPYLDVNELRTVVAVIEVKGQKNGVPVHSDDEEECDAALSRPDDVQEKFMHLSLSTLEEEEDDDDDDDDDFADIEETPQELLMNDHRDWLKSTRELPPLSQLALKRFLPQLIGEMMCASSSVNIRTLVSRNGLQFGIGLVGFEVYFVTVLDSCRGSRESVINSKSAFTNIFVTRPFNLLLKKDRRIIMKTLAASFILYGKWKAHYNS